MKILRVIVVMLLVVTLGCNSVYATEKKEFGIPNTLVALGLEDIGSVKGKQLPEVVVAIIDTGLDMDSFTTYFSESRILESSVNLLTGETGRYAAVEGTTGHGSAVAAIVAKGTPSNVKLMIIKASDDSNFEDDMVAKGVAYALDNGADIINISVGGVLDCNLGDPMFSPYISEVFIRACNEGTPIVCAAGNDGKEFTKNDEQVYYPAGLDFENIIGVGSVNAEGIRSSFSNYGYLVDFSTVGENVRTLFYNRVVSGNSTIVHSCGTSLRYGTSFATPAISSVYAVAATSYFRYGGERDKDFADKLTAIVSERVNSAGIPDVADLVKDIGCKHKYCQGFKIGKISWFCEKCGREK